MDNHDEVATEVTEAEVSATPVVEGEVLPPEAPTPAIPEGAEVSFQSLGKQRALEVAGMDDQVVAIKTTLREDILKVLVADPKSWGTYIAGFSLVMAERETKGKDIRTLRNVKSQVTRVLAAARGNISGVKASLENKTMRWEAVLKALPKRSAAGRPAGPTLPVAGEGSTSLTPAQADAQAEGKITETNIGNLIISLRATLEQLRKVSIGKHSPYGEYIAVQVLDMMEVAQAEYHSTFEKFSKGGTLTDRDGLMVALGLKEQKKTA